MLKITCICFFFKFSSIFLCDNIVCNSGLDLLEYNEYLSDEYSEIPRNKRYSDIRRVRGYHAFLTYSNLPTNISLDRFFYFIMNGLTSCKVISVCVGRETHMSGLIHYHVLIVFGKYVDKYLSSRWLNFKLDNGKYRKPFLRLPSKGDVVGGRVSIYIIKKIFDYCIKYADYKIFGVNYLYLLQSHSCAPHEVLLSTLNSDYYGLLSTAHIFANDDFNVFLNNKVKFYSYTRFMANRNAVIIDILKFNLYNFVVDRITLICCLPLKGLLLYLERLFNKKYIFIKTSSNTFKQYFLQPIIIYEVNGPLSPLYRACILDSNSISIKYTDDSFLLHVLGIIVCNDIR